MYVWKGWLILKKFHACRFTGRTIHNAINMGSYNYLGFAENNEDFLKTVADKMRQYGVGVCSTRKEIGEFSCCNIHMKQYHLWHLSSTASFNKSNHLMSTSQVKWVALAPSPFSSTDSALICYICISLKSLWQAPVTLTRPGIELEIKLPHLRCHHLLSFLVNYTAHMFNYLSVAAMQYE